MTAASELLGVASGPGDGGQIDELLSSLDHDGAEQLGRAVLAQIVSAESPFGVWGRVGRVVARIGCVSSGPHSAIRHAMIAGMTQGMIAQFAELPDRSTAVELHVEALLTGLTESMKPAHLAEALAQWETMVTLTANLRAAARADGYQLDEPAIAGVERQSQGAIADQPVGTWLTLLAEDTSPATKALDRFLMAHSAPPGNLIHDEIAGTVGRGITEAWARDQHSPDALSVLALSVRTVLATQRALRLADRTPAWYALVLGPVRIIVDHVTAAPVTDGSIVQLLVDHPGVLAQTLQEFAARMTAASYPATQGSTGNNQQDHGRGLIV